MKNIKLAGIIGMVILACSVLLISPKTYAEENKASDNPIVVKINKKNFPDKVFREKVKEYDTDKDGALSRKEIKEVKWLVLGGVSAERLEERMSLKGIKYLTELEHVQLEWCNCPKLDLSNNKKIRNIYCISTKLESIILPKKSKNELNLDFEFSKLKKLDLRSNTIDELYLNSNLIENIDKKTLKADKNCTINYAAIYGKKLKKVDVSHIKILKNLSVGNSCLGDSLNKIIIGKDLKKIHMGDTGLEKIDQTTLVAPKDAKLTSIECVNGKVKSVDIRYLKNIKILDIRENKVTKINANGCKKLYAIIIYEPKCKYMDLRGTKSLRSLRDKTHRNVKIIGSKNSSDRWQEVVNNYLKRRNGKLVLK